MIDFELAAESRIAQLHAAAATLRHERTAGAVHGRLSRRTRLRLRVGRHLVALGITLLAGGPRRARA